MFTVSFVLGVTSLSFLRAQELTTQTRVISEVDSTNKIQVVLLLDTSNSMDGLIEQAKSRLWTIVNTMTTLKYQGKTPQIEIALYEYGNDGLPATGNFIRQVCPLTTDLDLISEKLFSLRTNGGSEYCGAVIKDAVQNLNWNRGDKGMKLVYIAGNEGFNQGNISYKEVLTDAKAKNIFVNTIFCGNQQEGISLLWQDGAQRGQGKYFSINSNQIAVAINTPYDDQILKYNIELNATYIGYGSQGDEKKLNQVNQDLNAKSISNANVAERIVSKSKKDVYKNDSWDLVDKIEKEGEGFIEQMEEKDLPDTLKNLTIIEKKKIVKEMIVKREVTQKEIADLARKRQEYITEELKKQHTQDDLGDAISVSILELAKQKGYSKL